MTVKVQPRIRMIAGPNGSGKSIIKTILTSDLLGFYINPDEIEKNIKACGSFSFKDFDVTVEENEVLNYFIESPLLKKNGLNMVSSKITVYCKY